MRAGDEEYEAEALRIRTWRREGSSEVACKMLKFPRTLPRAGAYIVTCHRVIALSRCRVITWCRGRFIGTLYVLTKFAKAFERP